MKTAAPEPRWIHRTRALVFAPLRMTANVAFCIFVVIAAYLMMMFCLVVTFVNNHVVAPLVHLGHPKPQ